MITLTEHEREVLAQTVIDPDQWVIECFLGCKNRFIKEGMDPEAAFDAAWAQTREFLDAKVARWSDGEVKFSDGFVRLGFKSAKAKYGDAYLNRAQREQRRQVAANLRDKAAADQRAAEIREQQERNYQEFVARMRREGRIPNA
jgi:hypothetical protein